MPAITVTIDERFCGPPDSGNGGYSCGVLGALIDGPADVRLHAPPPLNTPLTLAHDGGVIVMRDADREIAEARVWTPDLLAPDAPDFADSEFAAAGYAGRDEHNFPTCFVCGPARDPGDGLRIFAGPVHGSELVAAPWVPDATLAAPDGRVREEFVWAALDCPSYFALRRPGLLALLGTLCAEVRERPLVGSRCVTAAWPLGHKGRVYQSGSAVYGEDGRLLALAHATWIELKPG